MKELKSSGYPMPNPMNGHSDLENRPEPGQSFSNSTREFGASICKSISISAGSFLKIRYVPNDTEERRKCHFYEFDAKMFLI